jgi:hypothetical protein
MSDLCGGVGEAQKSGKEKRHSNTNCMEISKQLFTVTF